MPIRKLSENLQKDRDPTMFTYFYELSKPDSNQGAPEPSVTLETTSESADNACEMPQSFGKKRITSQLCVVTEKNTQ